MTPRLMLGISLLSGLMGALAFHEYWTGRQILWVVGTEPLRLGSFLGEGGTRRVIILSLVMPGGLGLITRRDTTHRPTTGAVEDHSPSLDAPVVARLLLLASLGGLCAAAFFGHVDVAWLFGFSLSVDDTWLGAIMPPTVAIALSVAAGIMALGTADFCAQSRAIGRCFRALLCWLVSAGVLGAYGWGFGRTIQSLG